jgi:hypothetical protein
MVTTSKDKSEKARKRKNNPEKKELPRRGEQTIRIFLKITIP